MRTAAIGPVTAERLRSFGLTSDILPDDYRAESVVAAFRGQDVTGRRILLPRAQEARAVLPEELAGMGATVCEVAVYKTVPAPADALDLVERLERKAVDLITFTSSSTVKNFKALLPAGRAQELTSGIAAACIGPITADTARELGFEVRIVAAEYTIPGLCRAIRDHYRPGH